MRMHLLFKIDIVFKKEDRSLGVAARHNSSMFQACPMNIELKGTLKF